MGAGKTVIPPRQWRGLDQPAAVDAAATVQVPLPAVELSPVVTCGWCEQEASVSVNWECGHTSAMCALCFAPSDARDWTMDIMDWSADPAICPDCAG